MVPILAWCQSLPSPGFSTTTLKQADKPTQLRGGHPGPVPSSHTLGLPIATPAVAQPFPSPSLRLCPSVLHFQAADTSTHLSTHIVTGLQAVCAGFSGGKLHSALCTDFTSRIGRPPPHLQCKPHADMEYAHLPRKIPLALPSPSRPPAPKAAPPPV